MSEKKEQGCVCPIVETINLPSCGNLSYVNQHDYDFINGEVYREGKYFGRMIDVNSEEYWVDIEINNGNKYMKGQVQRFNFK